jgi:hypothetical protein
VRLAPSGACIAVAGLAATALAGCTPKDELSARLLDGELTIALCDLDRLRVELLLERDGELAGRYGAFFDGEALRAGDWVDEDGRRSTEAC